MPLGDAPTTAVLRAPAGPQVSVDDWTVEELDERIAEVRGLFLDTLEQVPG